MLDENTRDCPRDHREADLELHCRECHYADAETGRCHYFLKRYHLYPRPKIPRNVTGKGNPVSGISYPPIRDTGILREAPKPPLPRATQYGTYARRPEPHIDSPPPGPSSNPATLPNEPYADELRDQLDLLEQAIERSTAPPDPPHRQLQELEANIEQSPVPPDAMERQLNQLEADIEGEYLSQLESQIDDNSRPIPETGHD